MDLQTTLDTICNICRSPSDVLHIIVYLIPVVIALLISLYRTDRRAYNKYVYSPFITFLLKRGYKALIQITYLRGRGHRVRYSLKVPTWELVSNRLPYRAKATVNSIKKFLEDFKK